eukprot:426570-Pleurochrysis_carterae.AAC.1
MRRPRVGAHSEPVPAPAPSQHVVKGGLVGLPRVGHAGARPPLLHRGERARGVPRHHHARVAVDQRAEAAVLAYVPLRIEAVAAREQIGDFQVFKAGELAREERAWILQPHHVD